MSFSDWLHSVGGALGVVVAIWGAIMLVSARRDRRGSRPGPDSVEVESRRRVGNYQLCFGTALALGAVAGLLSDRDVAGPSVVVMGVSLALTGVAVVQAARFARTARRERQSTQGRATEVGLAALLEDGSGREVPMPIRIEAEDESSR